MKRITPYRIYFLLLLLAAGILAGAQPRHRLHSTPVSDTNVILPPSWAFGILYGGYTDQQQTIDRVSEIIRRGYPIDAYWIDSWFWSMADKGAGPKKYIDFVADTTAYPDRKAMWDFLQKHRIKGGFWVWNCILETGNEAAFTAFKSKGFFDTIYLNKDSWHNSSASMAMNQLNPGMKGTNCGDIQFSNPAAAAFFKEKMRPFFDEGADFLKLDRSAKLDFCKTTFELTQEAGRETKGRGFVLSHSFETASPEYKRYPAKWTDDTRSDWNIKEPLYKFQPWTPPVAFKENIAMFTDPAKATSVIPFLCNDMGGFTNGYNPVPDEELYIRWMQFSMFNPITEVFSAPENPTSNLAWLYSKQADTLFRNYARLRLQLFPYIYSYAYQTRLSAQQIMRSQPGHIYQYLFGNELLVAPVYEKGAGTRTVYLPAGNWVDYWSGRQFSGNNTVSVPAPVEVLPLFVKQGAVLPMRNAATSVEAGTNKLLTLHIYTGADGTFTLYEDDGSSNDYLKGGFTSTKISWNDKKKELTIAPVAGYYTGMLRKRQWLIYLHGDRKTQQLKAGKQLLPLIRSGNTVRTELPVQHQTASKLVIQFR